MVETLLMTVLGMAALAMLVFLMSLVGYSSIPQKAEATEAVVRLHVVHESRMYSVTDESGLTTQLLLPGWSGECEWMADGQRCHIRQEGFLRRRSYLEVSDVVVARAETSGFRIPVTMVYRGRRITIRPRNPFPLFSSDLEIVAGGRVVGSFVRTGLFSGPVTAELPAQLPKHIKLFLVWLGFRVWLNMA